MKTEISLPELGLVALTRAFLGAGLAFVVSDLLDTRQRRAVGWTLTGVGALTTIPLVLDIIMKRREQQANVAEIVDAEYDEPLEDAEEVIEARGAAAEDVLDPRSENAR
jgi:hypothetical protein